jgi:hypothetical protein
VSEHYEITGWDEHYENAASRKVESARWCPIPNRFDGDRISELIGEGGDGVYGAWCALLLLASRCTPRGVLLRSNGKPYTPASLQRVTGISKESFTEMLKLAETLGLISLESKTYKQHDDGHHLDTTDPSQKGMEWNGRKETPLPPKGGGMDGFDSFWQQYPRKTAKGRAGRAWKRLKCGAIADDVLAGLARCKASKDWKGREAKYLPYPATWLNSEGWLDEPDSGDTTSATKAKAAAFDALGHKVHAELFAEVQANDSKVLHCRGTTDTERAIRRLAREKGLI